MVAMNNIEIIDLQAVGVLNGIVVSADFDLPEGQGCLPYMQPEKFSIKVGTTTTEASATEVATPRMLPYTITGLPDSALRYVWVAAIDPLGNVGEYEGPVSATTTAGVDLSDIEADIDDLWAAVSTETTQRTNADSAFASQLTTVSARANEGSASGLFRMASTAGPAGYTTQILMQAEATDGAGYASAGIAIDVGGGTSRVRVQASQFVVQGSGGIVATFDSTATLLLARIPVIDSTKISVTSLSAINANAGTITAGTIRGTLIQSNTTGTRIQMNSTDNEFEVFVGGSEIARYGTNTGGLITLTINSGGLTVGGSALASGANNAVGLLGAHGTTGSLNHGIRGQAAGLSAGIALVGVSAAGGGYAVMAERNAIYSAAGYLPFTGVHEMLLPKDEPAEIGDIVVSEKLMAQRGVSDTLLLGRRSSARGQMGAYGILSRRQEIPVPDAHQITKPSPMPNNQMTRKIAENMLAAECSEFPGDVGEGILGALCGCQGESVKRRQYAKLYDWAFVNGVGEGLVNCCGRGGNLEIGDFIQCSDMPGKGEKMDGNKPLTLETLGRIVARVTAPVAFSHPDEVKLVPITYWCG